MKAKVGLMITTYENSQGRYNPILSHIFWGKDLEQAVNYAKSHPITDTFFASSFGGEMDWKGSVLKLSNNGEILSRYTISSEKELNEIMKELEDRAEETHELLEETNILQVIQTISQYPYNTFEKQH